MSRFWMVPRLVLLCLCVSAVLPAQKTSEKQKADPGASKAAKKPPVDIPALEKKAATGDAKAQLELGRAYRDGDGVKKDEARALGWLRKAAEQNLPEAQNALGDMYEQGRGTPRDYSQATAWYLKAAQQGNADAQLAIGCMYYLGNGVPVDMAAARSWIRKAAAQGLPPAKDMLRILFSE
jgi:TPR repeat protein